MTTTRPHSKVIRWRNDSEVASKIFQWAFSRDLHSEHRRTSNNSRLQDGNPVNESTILWEWRSRWRDEYAWGAPNLNQPLSNSCLICDDSRHKTKCASAKDERLFEYFIWNSRNNADTENDAKTSVFIRINPTFQNNWTNG